MNKIVISFIMSSIVFQVFAISIESKKVYGCLRKLVESEDSVSAKMLNKYNTPDYLSVVVYDCCLHPDSAQWTGFTEQDFNMDFGVYYIENIDAYLLIHNGSLMCYIKTYPDFLTPLLMKRIIEVRETDPLVCSEKKFINIIKNIYVVNHRHGRRFIPAKDTYEISNIDGMEIYKQRLSTGH